MNLLLAFRVLMSWRAWRRSRTLKAAGVGIAAGGAMTLDPALLHVIATVFNYFSPVDVSDAGMGAFLVFAVSVGAAVLRADTHQSLSPKQE